jgi:hypothetical protein
MFLRTSGKRPLTSVGGRLGAGEGREAERTATLANGHRGDDALDGILAFVAVFAVEVDTELIVFAFAGTSNAHGAGRRSARRPYLAIPGHASYPVHHGTSLL